MSVRKVLVCLTLILVLTAPAMAVAKRARDGNDSRGRLDIKSISDSHFQKKGKDWWRFRVATYDSFKNRDLVPQGTDEKSKALTINFDTHSGGGFDRVVYVQAIKRGGHFRLIGKMTRGRSVNGGKWSEGSVVVGPVEVKRGSLNEVEVAFPQAVLKAKSKFRWAVRTASGASSPTTNEVSFDYAPDNGLMHEHV